VLRNPHLPTWAEDDDMSDLTSGNENPESGGAKKLERASSAREYG